MFLLLTEINPSINWEALSTITTSLLSIVSIIISIISLRFSSKETNRILEENSRAYLSIYSDTLVTNKNNIYVIIKNFGNTQAIIETFEVDKITKKAMNFYFDKDFTTYIPNTSLAPNQNLTYYVNGEHIPKNHISEFKVNYKSGEKRYMEVFKFNLSLAHKLPSVGISTASTDKQFVELYQDYLRRTL